MLKYKKSSCNILVIVLEYIKPKEMATVYFKCNICLKYRPYKTAPTRAALGKGGKMEKQKLELLKDWGDEFDTLKQCALRAVVSCKDFFIIGGEFNLHTLCEWEVCDKFGLAYTDTSRCAALWCCGVEVFARYGEQMTLHGVAIDSHYKTVFIFTKPNGEEVEFLKWDFYEYQEHERKRHKAKMYALFTKKINKGERIILETLQTYEGKPYGEKTRQKIYDELNTKVIAATGLRVYYSTQYNCFEFSGLDFKRSIYAKILTSDNKITLDELKQLKPLEEFDGGEEFETVQKAAKILKEKAADLLPIIEFYNEHARKISQRNEDCENLYAVKLANIAKWSTWGQE